MTESIISGEIKLKGFDELEKILSGLSREDGMKILRQSLGKAATVIQQAAIDKAPSDSGELRRNIKIRIWRKSQYPVGYQIYVRAKRFQKNKSTGKREIAGLAYYAYFIEYGTGIYGPKKKAFWIPRNASGYLLYGPEKKRRWHGVRNAGDVMKFTTTSGKTIFVRRFKSEGMKARPFLRPAFDENVNRTIDRFGSEAVDRVKNYFVGNPVGMGMSEISAGVM